VECIHFAGLACDIFPPFCGIIQPRLQEFLQDVATFCPLATNSVENSHAQHQHQLFTFRGKAKSPAAAGECSVLSSLIREHSYLKTVVLAQTMPSRLGVSTMLKHLGRKKGIMPKLSRKRLVIRAVKRKTRPLCAWNVYQRKRLQELGNGSSLGPLDFKAAMKRIGQEWAQKSVEDREEFNLDARYRQSCRDELQLRPLTAGRPSARSTGALSHQPGDAGAAQDLPTNVLEQIAGNLAFANYSPLLFLFGVNSNIAWMKVIIVRYMI